MNVEYQRFIEETKYSKSSNTVKILKSLQVIGDYDYTDCTLDDLEKIILSTKPVSPRAIITACYVMGLYANYLGNDRMEELVKDIDKNALWLKAKPNAPKRFISYATFESVYHDIGVYEEYNAFYYQVLFRCLYEGIYNDDMSVVKNLKSSDIRGCSVPL